MMAFTSIFRRARRSRSALDKPRKRPGRSFAISLGALERRALLATIGPVAVTTASTIAAAISQVVPPAPIYPMNQPEPPGGTTIATSPGGNSSGSEHGPWTSGGGNGDPDLTSTSTSTSTTSVIGPTLSESDPEADPGHARIDFHVALAEANVSVDGVPTPEFALANAFESKIFVKLGFNGQSITLGAAQGIDHPQSVLLTDINGDGLPDLVVANSGGDNILVFPGLAGGLFGPEIDGGQGIAVGSDPVSVTVGDIDGYNKSEIVVANENSDTVSILNGQGTGADWTATLASTIGVGLQPVKTALVDVNHDGNLDLIVCESGSNDVAMYQGEGSGTFDTTNPTIIPVGDDPTEMFVGRFDKRPELDLITINAGSDDLSFVGGVFTAHATTQTFTSGGVVPDAGFAVDPNHSGILDLVVANSGDGHMALLQAGNDGLQLAGVITQADVPIPTGIAPATLNDDGLSFLVASAGQDAAELLHFDLGAAATFLSATPGESGAISVSDQELFAQLTPFGESALDLVAVFWAGSPDSEAISGEWGLREPSSITALYSPTEGQGDGGTTPTAEIASESEPPTIPSAVPSEVDPTLWARFVLGIDAALGEPGSVVAAVAAQDASDLGEDRPIDHLVRLERREIDPDFEATSTIDEAMREFLFDLQPQDGPRPDATLRRSEPDRGLEGIEAPAVETRLESLPVISSAVLLASRLILNASPPRPPSFRKKSVRNIFSRLWGASPARNRSDRV